MLKFILQVVCAVRLRNFFILNRFLPSSNNARSNQLGSTGHFDEKRKWNNTHRHKYSHEQRQINPVRERQTYPTNCSQDRDRWTRMRRTETSGEKERSGNIGICEMSLIHSCEMVHSSFKRKAFNWKLNCLLHLLIASDGETNFS